MARRSPILDPVNRRFGQGNQPDYLAVHPQQRNTTKCQTSEETRRNITGGRSTASDLNDVRDDPATNCNFDPG